MSQALQTLLEHPSLWRAGGSTAARRVVVASGHPELDAVLPGGGWPFPALVEIAVPSWGSGELSLFVPALRSLLEGEGTRVLAWLNPPHIPYAPALEQRGMDPARVVITTPLTRVETLWAMEQALRSGACAAVLGWADHAGTQRVRRLKLAAAEGHCMGVLFRTMSRSTQPSPANLRLALRGADDAVEIELLKVQGGKPGTVRMARERLQATLQAS
jgi:hypothetical protein